MSATACIDRTSLRHPGTGRQALANAAYLAVARRLAHAMGRYPIVRSVYVRRSLAAGEVAFGRSDIDLTLVLHDGCGTSEGARQLYALNQAVRGIRRVFPWLGQCEVHAASELADWAERESFRMSLEAANGVLLFGEPVAFPRHPIAPRQAAYRTAFWLDKYLPIALAGGRRDHLWKFVLEMWVTASLAVGRLTEPCLTRADTLRAWHRHAGPVAPVVPGQSVETLWRAAMALLSEVHAALRAPVPSPSRVLSCQAPLPPAGPARTVLVGTVDQLAPELARLSKTTLAFTPEALDLYLEYVNPAFHAGLHAVRAASLAQVPSAQAWMDALLRWSCPVLARKPGFGTTDIGVAPLQVRHAHRLLEALAGQWPPPMGELPSGLEPALSRSFRDYFLGDYVATYAAALEVRRRLRVASVRPG